MKLSEIKKMIVDAEEKAKSKREGLIEYPQFLYSELPAALKKDVDARYDFSYCEKLLSFSLSVDDITTLSEGRKGMPQATKEALHSSIFTVYLKDGEICTNLFPMDYLTAWNDFIAAEKNRQRLNKVSPIEDALNGLKENGGHILLPYSELSEDLKREADRSITQTVYRNCKEYIFSTYTVDLLPLFGNSEKELDQRIQKALHTARYKVEMVNGEPKVSYLHTGFVDAWKQDLEDDGILATIKEKNRTKKRIETFNAKAAAKNEDALMTIDNRIASFTTAELRDSLTSGMIFSLPKGSDPEDMFEQNGRLNTLSVETDSLEKKFELHEAFLMAMLQLASKSTGENTQGLIHFCVPTICKELGIDPREFSTKREKSELSMPELRLQAIQNNIKPFDSLVGMTPDGGYYRVLAFHHYDPKTETLTVSAPYLFRLIEYNDRNLMNAKYSGYNRLFLGSVVNEPNKAAVELANRILVGLIKRGYTPDKSSQSKDDSKDQPSNLITYRVKFSTLIDDCPQIKKELQDIIDSDKKNKTSLYNTKIKNAFNSAYKIIKTKSEAPERYRNLALPTLQKKLRGKITTCFDVPTKTTLDRELVITHTGRKD